MPNSFIFIFACEYLPQEIRQYIENVNAGLTDKDLIFNLIKNETTYAQITKMKPGKEVKKYLKDLQRAKTFDNFMKNFEEIANLFRKEELQKYIIKTCSKINLDIFMELLFLFHNLILKIMCDDDCFSDPSKCCEMALVYHALFDKTTNNCQYEEYHWYRQ